MLEFSTRGQFTNDEGTVKIGNLFYGPKGWMWIDADGRAGRRISVRKTKRGRAPTLRPPERRQRLRVRPVTRTIRTSSTRSAPNDPKLLTCDVTEGHLSSALPHLANIAYRSGRALKFDGKSETFVNDKQADGMLTREYRKGFEVPRV